MRETRNGAGNLKTSKNISAYSRVYCDVMSPRGESGNWANRTDLKPQRAVVGAEEKGCQSLLSQSGMWKQSSASQWHWLVNCGQPEVQGLGEVSQAAPQSSGGVGEYQEVGLKYLVLEYCQVSAPGTCEARKRDVGRGECRHKLHRNVAGIWKGA